MPAIPAATNAAYLISRNNSQARIFRLPSRAKLIPTFAVRKPVAKIYCIGFAIAQLSPEAMRQDIDRDSISDFMRRHGLTYAGMATHADVPLSTLVAILRGRRPYPATAEKLMAALEREPQRGPKLRHEIVRRHWYDSTTDEIAAMLGLVPSAVRGIARRAGLPPKPRRIIPKAAE